MPGIDVLTAAFTVNYAAKTGNVTYIVPDGAGGFDELVAISYHDHVVDMQQSAIPQWRGGIMQHG